MGDIGKQPVKAAFEIKKGARQVMTLSETEVEKYLDPTELLDGLEDGFRGIELGEVQTPPRPKLLVAGKGFSLAMPAWRPGMQLTVKIVNVFDGNLEIDLANHLALINLFDPNTGAASCVMDGTYITGIRTAASAVLSARLLSRSESRIATVIAGVQGREHLRLLPLIRGSNASTFARYASKMLRSLLLRAKSHVQPPTWRQLYGRRISCVWQLTRRRRSSGQTG